VSVSPKDLFDWAEWVAGKGSSAVTEIEMRAAIGKAYYGAYFAVVLPIQAAGIQCFEGGHKDLIGYLKTNAISAVTINDRAAVRAYVTKLDEMRVRRGKADYDLSLSRSQIMTELSAQLVDGRRILPTAGQVTGAILASSLRTRTDWPK
jgi:hypothetical protein